MKRRARGTHSSPHLERKRHRERDRWRRAASSILRRGPPKVTESGPAEVLHRSKGVAREGWGVRATRRRGAYLGVELLLSGHAGSGRAHLVASARVGGCGGGRGVGASPWERARWASAAW
jgi:hypothetical protein